MKKEIIKMLEGIDDTNILKLIYIYVKVAKKKADTK